MTEAQLLAAVMDLAGRFGLLAHHCRDSRWCDGRPGFPDVVLAGQRGLILAELKGPDGETSPGQDLWHWTLDQGKGGGPCPYRLWTPAAWYSGRIAAEMEAIA